MFKVQPMMEEHRKASAETGDYGGHGLHHNTMPYCTRLSVYKLLPPPFLSSRSPKLESWRPLADEEQRKCARSRTKGR